MKQRFLIVGANSDIAQACIPIFEEKGISLILAAHKPADITSDKHEVISLDVTQTDAAIATIASLEFDGIIYAAGALPDNETALFGTDAERVMAVNYTAAVRMLGPVAQKFKAQKSGVIVGISSVGAARGKSSNVIYGSAKSGFDHYLSGLRQYMHPHGVRVITIRPGFVATKMTNGMNLPSKLTAKKEKVARAIVKHALQGNRNVIYVKPVWRLITSIINRIPEPIFKRKQL